MIKQNEDLIFTDNTGNDKAVLGILEGPCADFVDSTRNGRKYTEDLWEKVFNNPIVTELIENGGIPGELDHPADREETDSSRIAIMMTEKPQKKDGQLWAKFSILNTPLGKIAYTLAKAGFKLGVSSRGSGDVYMAPDGVETVDEDTYDFKAFDLVLVPAVKAARLNLISEGLESRKISLKESLDKLVEEAGEDEKQLMQDTINNLGVLEESNRKTAKFTDLSKAQEFLNSLPSDVRPRMDSFDNEDGEWWEVYYDESLHINEDANSINKASQELRNYLLNWYNKNISQETVGEIDKSVWTDELQDLWLALVNYLPTDKDINQPEMDDIDEAQESTAVDNNEALINELQEALENNVKLQSQITELQEKLSVCYAKEAKLTEEVGKRRDDIKKLTREIRLNKSISEQLDSTNAKLNTKIEELNTSKQKVKEITEKFNSGVRTRNDLRESISNQNKQITELNEAINSKDKKIAQLSESVKELNESIDSLKTRYAKKVEEANKLVENYSSIAERAVDKYIESQALKVGCSINEIKNRLPESYTFQDIDIAVDDMQSYAVNIGRLPILTEKIGRISAKPSKNESLIPHFREDDITDFEMKIAGINNI